MNANPYTYPDSASDVVLWPIVATVAGGALGVIMYVCSYRLLFGRGALRALMIWRD